MTDARAGKPRLYTVPEANALLPRMDRLLARLRALYQTIAEARVRQQEPSDPVASGNGHHIASGGGAQRDARAEEFRSLLGELEALGIELKDLEIGLIDFFSLRKGEMVFLCWKQGEPKIGYWHTVEGGYAGRQPL